MKMRDFKILGATTTGWKSNVPERVNPQKQVAIAGTEVICPKCSDVIGRLSVPLYSGMRIPAAAIEFKPHQKKHPNQKAECRRCGQAYMRHFFSPTLHTRIHVAGVGWI